MLVAPSGCDAVFSSDMPSRPAARVAWTTGLALVLSALAAVSVPFPLLPSVVRAGGWLFLLAGAVWTWRESRSVALAADLFIAVTLVWMIAGRATIDDPALRLHLLVTSVLALLGYRLPARLAVPFVSTAAAAWLAVGLHTRAPDFGWAHYWVLASSLATVLVFVSVTLANDGCPRRRVDLIVSSGSGNTAHLATQFADGVRSTGAVVSVHRFQHGPAFRPNLDGDALAIAFPIYGCKPPWPFLVYLLRHLPHGRGKPAFILYTCIGGAENAGVLCWLLLTWKGYRVAGRDWGVYPLNVPTFRLGPARFWKRVDRWLPRRSEVLSVRRSGARFAGGRTAGIPFVFCLSPCFLVGILADNRWLDTILYRNHVFRQRCNQCGVCVTCCPMGRIRLVGGDPKGRGACMICMACVNNCPRAAMHLWCWTEYGAQYRSRFRRLVVSGHRTARKSGTDADVFTEP